MRVKRRGEKSLAGLTAEPAFKPKLRVAMFSVGNCFFAHWHIINFVHKRLQSRGASGFVECQPEMYDCESQADGEGDQAAADVHVVLVGDGEDDDQQQEGAKDLVCSQCVEGNLMLDILNFHSDSPMVG